MFVKFLIFPKCYNVGVIPYDSLCHRIRQRVEVSIGCRWCVRRKIALRVLSVRVTAAKVDHAKRAIGVVCGDEAATRLASRQGISKARLSGRYHLQHTPGPLIQREKDSPGLAGHLERINCFRYFHKFLIFQTVYNRGTRARSAGCPGFSYAKANDNSRVSFAVDAWRRALRAFRRAISAARRSFWLSMYARSSGVNSGA